MRPAVRLRPWHPFLALGAAILMCAALPLVGPGTLRPQRQADLQRHIIYPYRQWQSTGLKLQPGDTLNLRAEGQWQYSPIVGLTGPGGGRPAVDSYPLPTVPGGALIGRIGDTGQPFYVGRRYHAWAAEAGLLYLRINDDLLGDNQGVMRVNIDVTPGPTPAP
jgi:hypothetical protein